MKVNGVIVALFLGICICLVLVQPALAGLRVSGAKIQASVTPGGSYSYEMTVGNTSEEPMDIAVEVRGYGTSENSRFVVLETSDDNSPYTARELLSVSTDSFHLEPGESRDIAVTLKIPADVGDGGRYAIVFIHTSPKGMGTATVTAVAARVLLTIDGSNLITDSEVTQVTLSDIKPDGSLEALVTVANSGNHHYKPHIHGTLRSGNEILATASIEDDWPLIPSYGRQFKLSFVSKEPIPADKYEVDIEVRDDSGNLVAQHTSSFEVKEPYVPPPSSPAPPEQVTTAPAPPAKQATTNWTAIGGAVAAVIIVGLLIVIFLLLRRRRA